MITKSYSHVYDVAIVGSGPSGSSAAYLLASQGVKTIVIERYSLPRYKTCGGGVVYRALQKLPVNNEIIKEKEFYNCEMNFLNIEKNYYTIRDVPIITMTMRDKFDLSLLELSSRKGAIVRQKCEVLDIKYENNYITLLTTKEAIYARFVIAADGVMSTIAKKMKFKDERLLIPALEYEIYVKDSVLKHFSRVPRFDFGVNSTGYAWIFPKRDHLSIGILNMIRGKSQLKELFIKYLKMVGINNIDKMESHGYIIPVTPRSSPFAYKRIFLTGDAAGFADPVTAEGISFAIQSGQMAAQSIINGDLESTRSMDIYNTDIQRNVLPELRAGKILSTLLYEHSHFCTSLFRVYGQKLAEIMTDIYIGEKKYRDLLKNPMNYLKLIKCLQIH